MNMENKEFWSNKDARFIISELANSDVFQSIVCHFMELGILSPPEATEILSLEEELMIVKAEKIVNSLYNLDNRRPVPIEKIVEVFYRNGLEMVARHIDSQQTDGYSMRDEMCEFRVPIHTTPHMPFSASLPVLSVVPHSPPPLAEAVTVPDVRETKPFNVKVTPAKCIFGDDSTGEIYRNESMPRGLVFIVNMEEFENKAHKTRVGSKIDVENLDDLFTQMGYVVQKYKNLTKRELLRYLTNFRNDKRHEDLDSCVVVVMSHGKNERTFVTSDNLTMRDNEVFEMFNNISCRALFNKPKIFIFQFCRGDSSDSGVEHTCKLENIVNVSRDLSLKPWQTDGASIGETILLTKSPTPTDIFCIYATVRGYVAYLDKERGSWLVESICQVFMEHAWQTDLEALIKKVSQRLKDFYSSEGMKQITEFSQIGVVKHFYFNPQPLMEINCTIGGDTQDKHMNMLSQSLSASSINNMAVTPPHQRRHLQWEKNSRPSTPDPFNYDPQQSTRFQFRSRHASGASTGSGGEGDSSAFGSSVRPRSGEDNFRRFSFSNISYRKSETTSSNYADVENENFEREDASSAGLDVVDTEYGRMGKCPPKGTADDFRRWRMKNASSDDELRPSSMKRQLSVPSDSEAMTKVYRLKNYLEINDMEHLTEPLNTIEDAIKKNKMKGKKKKEMASSLDLDY